VIGKSPLLGHLAHQKVTGSYKKHGRGLAQDGRQTVQTGEIPVIVHHLPESQSTNLPGFSNYR